MIDQEHTPTLRVVKVIEGTAVDGPGLRTSVYFAGCEHHCPGCHNSHTWPLDSGTEMTVDELYNQIINAESENVTFSGGDPMLQAEAIIPLAKRLKESGHNIWCYTGYTYNQVAADSRMSRLMDYIDVLVDGPYIEDQRDPVHLLFRGSANQHLVDVAATHASGNIVEWKNPDFTIG